MGRVACQAQPAAVVTRHGILPQVEDGPLAERVREAVDQVPHGWAPACERGLDVISGALGDRLLVVGPLVGIPDKSYRIDHGVVCHRVVEKIRIWPYMVVLVHRLVRTEGLNSLVHGDQGSVSHAVCVPRA